MRVRVRLFASLREAAGSEMVHLDMPEGATVGDAWMELCSHDKSLGAQTRRVLIALNRRYVSLDTLLSEGDEVALFPPVSGG